MKAFKFIILFALLSVCGFDANAQGSVDFSTYSFAPVTNLVTGQRIPAGAAWWAQLYYGPAGASESQLISVTNAPVHLFVAGFISGGNRFTDPAVVAGGSLGTFQVRVWSATLGNTWEVACLNWIHGFPFGDLGKSNLGLIRTGIVGDPTQPPASLGVGAPGIQPFTVGMPEPGVWALGLVGALAMLWFRRRV